MTGKIRIGVSACLLGQKVRYDGNHKQDRYLTDTLGRYFEFVPVCPEVAIGLGVPRPPIRLVRVGGELRALGVDDPTLDVTRRLDDYGRKIAHSLDDLSGYILKNRSPSCGMERVPVYAGHARSKAGRGIFAAALLSARPDLPVEEEGRLGDVALRDNFLERVFACHRWQQLKARGLTAPRLVEFHTRHKLGLLAHDRVRYDALGRLVAGASKKRLRQTADEYYNRFMEALRVPATPARHANVLTHLLGYLKRVLDAGDKAELLDAIHAYRRGEAPRVVPLTLLAHHFRRHPHPYVAGQLYLYPDPDEMLLRSTL